VGAWSPSRTIAKSRGRECRLVPRQWIGRGGRVTIQYGRFPFFDWLAHTHEPLADVTLNGSIPWEIEFHGGVSRLNADLSELPLRALDLTRGRF
jgi:hypothetical protein